MKYCSTGYAESQVLEDAVSIRDIMYAFMDNHILARIEKKLQEAKTVVDLYQALNDEKELFWPTFKCHKTLIKSKRKN